MALLIHGENELEDRGKYRALVESIRRDYPDLIAGMLPSSANEVRELLRKKQVERPLGVPLQDIPIVKLDPEFWAPHFALFARKLLLALHYQCLGTPLSSNGKVCHWIHSNVDIMGGRFPDEVLALAERIALPSRQKRMLSDQFAIRWNAIPEKGTTLFCSVFHGMLTVSGITTEIPDEFSEGNRLQMTPPFSHQAT